jgi:hypothetical protein
MDEGTMDNKNGFFCNSHIIIEANIKHPDSSEDGTGNGLAPGTEFFNILSG